MKNLFWLVALLIALGPGCAHRKRSSGQSQVAHSVSPERNPSGEPQRIITPAGGLHGTVTSVNANLRFAILTFPPGQMPEPGRRLDVFRNGLRVGELSVTRPQRDENTAADLLNGEVAPGDEVRSQ